MFAPTLFMCCSIVNKLLSLEACPAILLRVLQESDQICSLCSVILTEEWVLTKAVNPSDSRVLAEAFSAICRAITTGILKDVSALPLMLSVSHYYFTLSPSHLPLCIH